MRCDRANWPAAILILIAAALPGCASSKKYQTDNATRRTVVPPAVVAASQAGAEEAGNLWRNTSIQTGPVSIAKDSRPPQSGIQQASFSQPTPAPPSPAEVIVAPDARPLGQDRPALPLDLPTALGMTQGQNPRVAFAQAQIAQSQAAHEAARALWLPSLRAGGNYNKHEGRIQQVEGQNIIASRGAAFGGFGANAVGAGSPAIPGVYAYFYTADAIFQRQITGYALRARESQGTAVTNDQLLETALAYLA